MSEKKREAYKITPEGSLGLLALGYEGLVAWRKVRHKSGQLQELLKKKNDKEEDKE